MKSGIVASHSANEGTDLRVELGAATPSPRFPAPVETEAFAMPAQDGLRLDDEEVRPPVSPEPGKPEPEDPVSPTEPRALHRALKEGYLLAERQVLGGERRAALEQQPKQDGSELQYAP